MFQDFNGNNQQHAVMSSNMSLPCIYENQLLEDVGVVPSYGHVNKIILECQEEIDWNDIDVTDTHLKSNKPTVYTSDQVIEVLIEDGNMNMYEDNPVPFSQGTLTDIKTGIHQNRYVNSLLHLWRESSFDIVDSSAESTQVNLSQDESEGFSLHSAEFSCSSSTVSDDEIEDYLEGTEEIPVVSGESAMMTDVDSFDVPEMVPIFNNARTDSLTQEYGQTGTGAGRNYFLTLRSVSPELARSLSPISSRSSSPRFMRSPSPLEFLQQSFASLPLNSTEEAVFYEDRYLVRSISPVPADHLVPDVDVDYPTLVEQTEEFPSFRQYQRARTLRSCLDDQVVPEFIEE